MGLDVARIQAICFDVDGTLSDTDDLWAAALARALAPLRLLSPRADLNSFAHWALMTAERPGNFLYSCLDWANLDDDLARLTQFLVPPRAQVQDDYWIVQGVRETLFALHARYSLAVISARGERHTRGFLARFGLDPLFPVVATSFTCRHTKPFPDPVLWAAKQMNVDPRNCLMVGDTPVDIQAGRRAGAQTVGVLSGFGRQPDLTRAGADLILPSAAALWDTLLL